MSGINAPQIVTYQYMVSNTFDTYVNVSFPFRVRITDVWFTGDRKLLGGTPPSGNVFDSSFRELKLSAMKAKSPRVVLSNYDPPSDWAPFFGYNDPEAQTDWVTGSDEYKPTIWLGLPDDATADILKDSTTQFLGQPFYDAGFRSSTAQPPAKDAANSPYWGNNGWSSGQFAANKYKTDIGIMNPDEMVSFFVYNSDGDWTDYAGDGIATISIAYVGIGAGTEPGDNKTPWSDWWYD